MKDTSLQDQIDDATFDFSLGDGLSAKAKLEAITAEHPDSFNAWLSLSEVLFADDKADKALAAAEKAHALDPDDVHVNTSLSRIWIGLGNKEKAEHYGAQARMLGWKETLKNPPETEAS